MNEQLTQQNKKKLLAEQKRLQIILGHEGKQEGAGEFPGEYKPDFPNFGDKPDENASEVTAYETNLGVTRDLEAKLAKVEMALKRIEDGIYGRCSLGDEIEEKRLLAEPTAETCLKHSQ